MGSLGTSAALTDSVVKDIHATTQDPAKLVKVSHKSVPPTKHVIQGASEACRNMKIRNDWLAATHANQDSNTMTSNSIKSSTEKEKFFMDKKSSKKSENIKTVTSQDCSHVINVTEQNRNINVSEDPNNKDILNSKNSSELTTNNVNSMINSKSSSAKTNSFINGAVKTLDNESFESGLENVSKGFNISATRHSLHAQGTTKLSRDKCNNEEIISTHGQDLEIRNGNYDELTLHCDSNQSENTKEKKQINVKKKEIQGDSKGNISNSEGPVPNGAVTTNGWPDMKGYTIEQKENLQNTEVKIKSELNTSSTYEENLSSEIHDKADSAKEDKTPTLVKEKKDSKVLKFVRMFNRKDAPTAEGSERSSIRRNPSRVWGMCLQVQSPNAEDENYIDFGSKWSERDSIKSEPLIDNNFSEIKSSSGVTERGITSSSYSDIEEAGHQSLDSITCDSLNEKKKNLKLDNDKKNKNLIRNIGGRRSFDRPQRMARILTKRSNTLDDVDSSSSIFSRSSKTLPASPTSGDTGSEQDSNVSHPFYRRFYSHCMILPMRKRKKETDKKFNECKTPNVVIDTSPQSTAVLWQNEEGSSNNVNEDFKEVHASAASPKKEEELNDSPRKLPVIDDLLAEIMENVTLMELDMEEGEKRLSFHNLVEEGICKDPDNEHGVTHNPETLSATRILNKSLTDIKDASRNGGGTAADHSDSWDGRDNPEFKDTLAHTNGIKISRSSSRVGSLISKFEQSNS